LVPDLPVEVLSESNTPLEMDEKLRQYFKAGARLVWYIDPATRSAKTYSSPTDVTLVEVIGSLEGGIVLPGLQLSLAKLFETADRQRPTSPNPKTGRIDNST